VNVCISGIVVMYCVYTVVTMDYLTTLRQMFGHVLVGFSPYLLAKGGIPLFSSIMKEL
jgi:hypothetical protein